MELARITAWSLEDLLDMEPEWFAAHYAVHFPTNAQVEARQPSEEI